MDEFNYRPNSNKFKEKQKEVTEEKKKVEKVVSGTVKTKKQNELSKFARSFISEDAKDIKSYVLEDIVIPTAKKVISEIIGDVTDIVLFGKRGKGSRGHGSKISYRSFYDDRDRGSRTVDRVDTRSRFDYDDLVFASRGDAEAVLEQMIEVLETYKVVTVADLYDSADQSAPYTSNRYGWTNLANAEVQRVRDGYVIKLPRALPID